MKKLILAATIFALAASQVPTANARVFVGVGVGVGPIGVGTSVGFGWGHGYGYYHSPYYGYYGYYPRPYWGTGFYNSGYYYPSDYASYYNPAPPTMVQPVQPQPQPQPQLQQAPPQNVTINNNYYNAPSTPMSSANSLFGR